MRRSAGLLALALACGAATAADTGSPTPFQLELGVGRQVSSVPLLRLGDDGSLQRLPGMARSASGLQHAALSAQTEGPLQPDSDWRLALSARLDTSHLPQASGQDLGQLGGDALLRHPALGGVAGLGISLEQLRVGGSRFRQTRLLRADWAWTPASGEGFAALALSTGLQRHPGQFSDLDARVLALDFSGRLESPWPGLAHLDLQTGWHQERNRRGIAALSPRGLHLRVASSHDIGPLTLGWAWMLQAERRPAADGEPARHDLGRAVELSLDWPLDVHQSLSLQHFRALNHSGPQPLGDYRFRSSSLGWSLRW